MQQRSPVFLGLIRPPRFLGLPLQYAVLWIFGTTLLMIWTQTPLILVLAAIVYPALWLAAEWDPNFIEVMRTVIRHTPPTKNRKIWEGDSYGP